MTKALQRPRPSVHLSSDSRIAVVDASRCTGCGRCVAACPWHLLSLEPQGWIKSAVISDLEACTGCKKCEVVCPFHAITMLHARRTPIRST